MIFPQPYTYCKQLRPLKEKVWLCLLATVLISLCGASSVAADGLVGGMLYNGKSSDVFKENSSEVKNTKILKTVVKKAKKTKGRIPVIIISIMCAEIVEPGEKKQDLAVKRADVLKKFFQKHLDGVEVIGQGKTKTLSPEEAKALKNSNAILDVLTIMIGDSGHPGDISGGPDATFEKPKEEWKQKLLKRYRKVEQKHYYLCRKKEPYMEVVETEDCFDYGPYTRERYQCVLRRKVGIDNECIAQAQYELDPMLKHQETSAEVYRIAQEISKKDPEAGSILYDPTLLDEEVQRSYQAMKHYRRTGKVVDLGIKFIGEYDAGRQFTAHYWLLERGFSTWVVADLGSGTLLEAKGRKQTVNHLMDLHNFVRENLGLWPVENSLYHPICVVSVKPLPDGAAESIEDAKNSVKLYMKDYKIPNIPLD